MLESRAERRALFSAPDVKELFRWATGKRLTYRLPKLSLLTLPPPWNGPDVRVNASPTRDSNCWGSRSIFQILDEAIRFLVLKLCQEIRLYGNL